MKTPEDVVADMKADCTDVTWPIETPKRAGRPYVSHLRDVPEDYINMMKNLRKSILKTPEDVADMKAERI